MAVQDKSLIERYLIFISLPLLHVLPKENGIIGRVLFYKYCNLTKRYV